MLYPYSDIIFSPIFLWNIIYVPTFLWNISNVGSNGHRPRVALDHTILLKQIVGKLLLTNPNAALTTNNLLTQEIVSITFTPDVKSRSKSSLTGK
jgi:hypothetical protein